MNIKFLWIALTIFASQTEVCLARQIFYGSEAETVAISYGGPTILRFPEEVKTISKAAAFRIAPADPNAPDYKTIAITPRRSKGSSNVTFLLADGSVVHTRIRVFAAARPEKTDSFYDFKPKEMLVEKSKQDKFLGEMEFMKAMIRQDNVIGYKVKRLKRRIESGHPDILVTLMRIYTGFRHNGYVFLIKNLGLKPFSLSLEELSLGAGNTAILSQVDCKVLEPVGQGGDETILRIVAKPGSTYKNMALPVAQLAGGQQ